jgi:hypothetical protein
MQEVFHIKNAVKHILNIWRPLFWMSEFKTVSTASNRGTNAIKSKGAVNGIGGHASQSINAVSKARM